MSVRWISNNSAKPCRSSHRGDLREKIRAGTPAGFAAFQVPGRNGQCPAAAGRRRIFGPGSRLPGISPPSDWKTEPIFPPWEKVACRAVPPFPASRKRYRRHGPRGRLIHRDEDRWMNHRRTARRIAKTLTKSIGREVSYQTGVRKLSGIILAGGRDQRGPAAADSRFSYSSSMAYCPLKYGRCLFMRPNAILAAI